VSPPPTYHISFLIKDTPSFDMIIKLYEDASSLTTKALDMAHQS
jgi:hypothetical protein